MTLLVNTVIVPVAEDGKFERARIVHIGPSANGKGRVAYTVPLFKQALPQPTPEAALLKAEKEGQILFAHHTARAQRRDPRSLPARYNTIKQAAWSRIKPLVKNVRSRTLMLDRETRGSLIAGRARETNVQAEQIYRDLYRYFRGGMTEDALYPDFRSVEVGSLQPDGQKKRGRKPDGVADGKRPNNPALTEQKRAAILRIINAKVKVGVTAKDIFEEVKDKLYSSKVLQEGMATKYVHLPEHKRITEAQFMRVFRRANTGNRIKKRQLGAKEWGSKAKASLGASHETVDGPGQLYVVDWTGTQVELSAVDHPEKNIGTAIIYFVVDVWSKMIVGFFLTIKGASWDSASLALFNAFSDNTELYQHYGIKFAPEDIVSGIPNAVRGDLGSEVVSKASTAAVGGVKIDFQTARAWTGPDKADVESANGAFKKNLFRRLAGFRPKMQKRGSKNPRSEACLTLHDLTAIVIEEILKYNRRPLCLKSVPSIARKARIRRTPISLWHWGLPNCTGYLRKEDPEELYVKLLPEQDALITRDGLKVGSSYYECDELARLDMFSTARLKGRGIPCKVRVDPTRPWVVMRLNENGTGHVRCKRIDKQGHYHDYHHEDVMVEAMQHAKDKRRIEAEEEQARSDTRANQDAVVRRAKARRKAAGVVGPGGGKERIRANRDEEKQSTSASLRRIIHKHAEGPPRPKSRPRRQTNVAGVRAMERQTASGILRALRGT